MALKGNQKKLDKNNNNRIDAQDFKILKAEKAKDRGMGLQDEKVKPGKVMKARVGKSVQGTTAASANKNTFRGYQKVFDTGADRSTPKAERGVSTIVGVKPNSAIGRRKKKRVTYKSMDEMRQKTLGYKKGESTQAFKARKANENFAKQAAKATGLRGKAALAIAAAGVGAIQYLKSKMKKKDEPKKKMGGGMMMKPMRYKLGAAIGAIGAGAGVVGAAAARANKKFADKTAAKKRDSEKVKKKMGGGMMKRPMGYKKGMSIKGDDKRDIRKTESMIGASKSSRREQARKKMGGGMMQKYAEGGDAKRSPVAEQARRMGQRKPKPGALGRAGRGVGKSARPKAGIPSLPGKRKEDSSVTLGKFMKAKTDALNESVKAGGMKADRVIAGSNMRSPRRFRRDVEEGKYSKPSKDAAYYKSIGLTGERGDRAVKDFFKPEKIRMKNIMAGNYMGGGMMNKPMGYKSGKSIKVKCKLGKNKPTKMY